MHYNSVECDQHWSTHTEQGNYIVECRLVCYLASIWIGAVRSQQHSGSAGQESLPAALLGLPTDRLPLGCLCQLLEATASPASHTHTLYARNLSHQTDTCYTRQLLQQTTFTKDKAKEKANLKAKKNVLPPPLLPYMPSSQSERQEIALHHPITFSVARLVIVAGPALLPLHHLPSICSPTWPGLSLWQVPPFHRLPPFPSLPPLYPNHQSFPPLRPDLSLWQVPPHPHLPISSSPLIPPSSLSLPPIPITPARLAIVAGLV